MEQIVNAIPSIVLGLILFIIIFLIILVNTSRLEMQLYAILNVKEVPERWPMGYKPQTAKRSSMHVLMPYSESRQVVGK